MTVFDRVRANSAFGRTANDKVPVMWPPCLVAQLGS